MGGAGSAVSESLERQGLAVHLLQLGLPDQFIEQGDHAVLLQRSGLDAAGLVRSIRNLLPE
jgi:1-deoxy-D-xylulose-5-phosphate synthase